MTVLAEFNAYQAQLLWALAVPAIANAPIPNKTVIAVHFLNFIFIKTSWVGVYSECKGLSQEFNRYDLDHLVIAPI